MRARTPLIGGLVVAITLTASGCPGGSEQKTGSGGQVAKGGILRIGTADSITSFNPFNARSLQSGTATSMVYPQLLQLDYSKDKGYRPAPDFAESWRVSADGKEITFRLRPNAHWSDGRPLTAEDAAWTLDTIVKFQEGPTGQLVSLVEGLKDAEAVDPTTVKVTYDRGRSNALTLIGSGLSILPKHIWAPHAKGNGRGLRIFRPEGQPGGLVSGGPYKLKRYERRGTTVYEANPSFYGPASNARAVALIFFTNTDAMVEDLTRGRLDVVESVPTAALNAVQRNRGVGLVSSKSGLQADLFINSNPRKPRHRELLDPRVKEALALCVDRQQIIDVIFQGRATPVETMVGSLAGPFQNTGLQPRRYDCAAGNRILDGLGYRRGPGGVRAVPATTGKYAEPAHNMSYEVVTVAGAGEYNVDRTAEIVRKGWEQLGVKVVQKVTGDETATSTYLNGADCDPETSTGYTAWDIDLSYSVAEIEPLSTLSGELKLSWCAWNFTGFDNPEYDRLYQDAVAELDPAKRRQLMWRMQEIYHKNLPTIPIAEKQEFSAYSKKWAGFLPPEAAVYTKRYYTAPHLVG